VHKGGQKVTGFGGDTIRKIGVFTPETVSGASREQKHIVVIGFHLSRRAKDNAYRTVHSLDFIPATMFERGLSRPAYRTFVKEEVTAPLSAGKFTLNWGSWLKVKTWGVESPSGRFKGSIYKPEKGVIRK